MGDYIRILAIVAIGLILVLLFRTIRNRTNSSKVLYRKYLLQLLQLFVIVYCIFRIIGILNPKFNPKSILLTGSALVVAIVGFAAQTAISDVICGFLISIQKPFEIGDRIIIDGMEPGIVEDITLRHIVVAIYDGLKIIVPNSQLNTKTVINFSYKNTERNGVHLQYKVSFDTDVQKATDIIRDSVSESPYTLGVERNGVKEDSGPVYFLKYIESAIILETTIFVPKGVSTYTATTDVNIRVHEGLRKNGIEIPYNYINVVDAGNAKEKVETAEPKIKAIPKKRHFRTNDIKLSGKDSDIPAAEELAASFAKKQRLSQKETHQVELMAEESIALLKAMLGEIAANLWIEGSGLDYKIHIRMNTSVGSEDYKRLISLSSSGKNEAVIGVSGRIYDAMMRGVTMVDMGGSTQKFEWDLNSGDVPQDELSESILAAISDGIRVSVTKERVELVVEKKQ